MPLKKRRRKTKKRKSIEVEFTFGEFTFGHFMVWLFRGVLCRDIVHKIMEDYFYWNDQGYKFLPRARRTFLWSIATFAELQYGHNWYFEENDPMARYVQDSDHRGYERTDVWKKLEPVPYSQYHGPRQIRNSDIYPWITQIEYCESKLMANWRSLGNSTMTYPTIFRMFGNTDKSTEISLPKHYYYSLTSLELALLSNSKEYYFCELNKPQIS